MPQNGRLRSSSLRAIPGGRLDKSAAAAWMDMREMIGEKHGVWIKPLGGDSSYRTHDKQVYYWNLYKSGRGNPAAPPGTSNHGWGKAVDVATQEMAYYIRRYGPRYGWSWDEGRRVGEWWHMRYVGGYTAKPKFVPLQQKSTGKRVLWVQRRLRAKGYLSVKANGFYGEATRKAVWRFQKKKGLTADGVVGKKTWAALSK